MTMRELCRLLVTRDAGSERGGFVVPEWLSLVWFESMCGDGASGAEALHRGHGDGGPDAAGSGGQFAADKLFECLGIGGNTGIDHDIGSACICGRRE